ncbi:MAG: RluA family pseudouridine synthase [Candidatus Omnitrophica bacterium]|nr:RluA family pseudouridine synthase [Candidatus Omnitrophota bacterium]
MKDANNKTVKFEIDDEMAGIRVDKFLARKFSEDHSRMYISELIKNDHLKVNGKQCKPSYSLQPGDIVELFLPQVEIDFNGAENIALNLLYEDEDIIVVNKPAGMVVHPGAGNRTGTLVNALLHHCSELADTGNSDRPGIVHRLDKDTSGIVIIAKNAKALRSLSDQFKNRKVEKVYLAVVKGYIEEDSKEINFPISRHPNTRTKMAVDIDGGKEAKTTFKVVDRFRGYTLLKIKIDTGRTHQIRVHMNHLGFPVVGDKIYGRNTDMARQALHAFEIEIIHPGTNKKMRFKSPIPDDIMRFINGQNNKAD